MSFLKSFASAVVQIALLPIEVIKDAATLGGSITDQPEPYSIQRLKKIGGKIEDAVDDLDN